jgi:hypothetical protein
MNVHIHPASHQGFYLFRRERKRIVSGLEGAAFEQDAEVGAQPEGNPSILSGITGVNVRTARHRDVEVAFQPGKAA